MGWFITKLCKAITRVRQREGEREADGKSRRNGKSTQNRTDKGILRDLFGAAFPTLQVFALWKHGAFRFRVVCLQPTVVLFTTK